MDETSQLSSPSNSNNSFVDIGVDVEIPNIPSPPTPNTPSPPTPNFSMLHNFLASLITANPQNNVSEPSEVSDTDDIGNEIPIGTFDPLTSDPADPPTQMSPADPPPEITTEITDPPPEITTEIATEITDPPPQINQADPPHETNPTDPDSATPTENPPPVPSLPLQNLNFNWLFNRITCALLIITLITTSGLLIHFSRHKKSRECIEEYSVAIDGKGDFHTISAALEAAPDHSPYKFCIILRKGEYHETVNIGHEKTNIVLRGEGVEETTIISNASFEGDLTIATLSVRGQGFYGRDFTVVNTAENGVAVSNEADHSVFYNCRMKGVLGSALHFRMGKHFYRGCHLYGRNDVISGSALAYFQKCELHKEKVDQQGHTTLISEDGQEALSKANLIFHRSSFYGVGNSIFLVNALGEYCSIVLMQSYLDASISGYIGNKYIPDTTHVSVFDNHGPGATTKVVPEFVHVLVDVRDASRFSLRLMLESDWIPSDIDYDLDVDS